MNQTNYHIPKGGEHRNMERYELDRLFGLALTDARFFRQLREHPYHAVSQFELTDSETRAVVSIAPAVSTIQELAVQLDVWMTGNVVEVAAMPVAERISEVDPVLHQMALSDQKRLDGHRQSRGLSYNPDTAQLAQQDEQRICLNQSELIFRN
jgi:hypothetical protein